MTIAFGAGTHEVEWDLPECEKRLSALSTCSSALVGSRTPNLLIRSQVLYPIELRVQYIFRGEPRLFLESGCEDKSKNGTADSEDQIHPLRR